MTTQQQELETLWRRSREVCPTCKGETSIVGYGFVPRMCDDCSGTGSEWPGFSKVCVCVQYQSQWAHLPLSKREKLQSCMHEMMEQDCQGSGRVPVSVAEAVLWILETSDFASTFRNNNIVTACVRLGNTTTVMTGETPALALFAAMKEAE